MLQLITLHSRLCIHNHYSCTQEHTFHLYWEGGLEHRWCNTELALLSKHPISVESVSESKHVTPTESALKIRHDHAISLNVSPFTTHSVLETSCASTTEVGHWNLHSTERLLQSLEKCQYVWPLVERNSIWGQWWGLITQRFCINFFSSIKEVEKASDINIRRGQKEYPPASF